MSTALAVVVVVLSLLLTGAVIAVKLRRAHRRRMMINEYLGRKGHPGYTVIKEGGPTRYKVIRAPGDRPDSPWRKP